MRLSRRGLLGAMGATMLVAEARGEAAAEPVNALLARMTLEEKAGQLSCFSDTIRPVGRAINPGEDGIPAADMLARVRAGRVGMLFNGIGVEGGIRAQKAALASRLGIPLLFAADVIHGAQTIFPIPLAEAAAFDPGLSERIARGVAAEASALGLHWTFAPMADVARDQRWGRVAEGAGEDPYLGSLLAAARVRGFQGDDLRRADTLCATPKHFAGYGAVTGGMEYAAVDLSDATMRETHLPPFASAFAAGAGAVMASFTEVNGVPVSASAALLTRLLRDEMRFDGLCVSDYDAVRELIAHGVASDEADAARVALLAGIDMEMQSGLFLRHLPDLVAAGRVPMARVDQAVRRVLAFKQRLGLFDDPFRSLDRAAERTRVGTPALRALAREAAQRSVVLLRNEGALLPIAGHHRRIALIGPFGAARDQLDGPWSFAGYRGEGVDLATALRARIGRGRSLTVEPGSGVEAPLEGGVARAVAAARGADLVLLAVGEPGGYSGEGNSRTAITIPAVQQALAEAVAATGTPAAVLLRHGRALALEGAVADARAILATWFLGCETGPALADILLGEVEPSGRLPVSFPFATGQEPWSYDRPATGRPSPAPPAPQGGTARWRDAPDAARYAFGHGLGYTMFALEAMQAPAAMRGPVRIGCTVRNTGARAGTETVQLYVHPRVARRARPRRLLRGVARVTLAPGEARTVSLPLAPADIASIGADGRWSAEPGDVDVWLARSSADPGLRATLRWTGG